MKAMSYEAMMALETAVHVTANRLEAAFLIALEGSSETGLDAQWSRALLQTVIDAHDSSKDAVTAFRQGTAPEPQSVPETSPDNHRDGEKQSGIGAVRATVVSPQSTDGPQQQETTAMNIHASYFSGASLAVEAHSDELTDLIEAHKVALARFEQAIDDEQEMEHAYKKAHPETVIANSFLGGGVSISNGHEECREHIAKGYEHQRERLVPLSRIAPDLAEQVRIALVENEAENMVEIDRTFALEEARQEAFGYAAAKRNYSDASDAETQAGITICAYECRSLDEARRKFEYLLSAGCLTDDLKAGGDSLKALLRSFSPT